MTLVKTASEEQMKTWGEVELYRMEQMDAYIALRGARNINEMADVPGEKMNLYNTHYMKPVHFERRIKATKWCVLRLPNASMAQQAGMSTEAFEKFYFDVCNLDYGRLSRALRAPGRADAGRARGPHPADPRPTCGSRSRGYRSISCAGEMNIPDGEVFTAPVRDSVEGYVRFNTPTVYQGTSFDGVRLEFAHGRIVAAECAGGDAKKLRRIFETDEGASHIGEWSIGCNPAHSVPDA